MKSSFPIEREYEEIIERFKNNKEYHEVRKKILAFKEFFDNKKERTETIISTCGTGDIDWSKICQH